MKTAILFPGQGAQYPGMGKTMYAANPTFKDMVDHANTMLPYDLRAIMFQSEAIYETRYAQPALFVMGCALYEAFKQEGLYFDQAAGLSIGEYAALYARGVFDFKTGLDIVDHRAAYMQKAAEEAETSMLAVRTDMDTAKRLVDPIKHAYISNYNMRNQMVVAGSKEAIMHLKARGETLGIKRMVPLNTSGAFHTPFMASARIAFEQYLAPIEFNEPETGLYLNVTGKAYQNSLKTLMVDQMTHTVQFNPMVETMIEDGLAVAFEAGPGKTLSTFVKKTDKSVQALPCEDETSFLKACELLRSETHV